MSGQLKPTSKRAALLSKIAIKCFNLWKSECEKHDLHPLEAHLILIELHKCSNLGLDELEGWALAEKFGFIEEYKEMLEHKRNGEQEGQG